MPGAPAVTESANPLTAPATPPGRLALVEEPCPPSEAPAPHPLALPAPIGRTRPPWGAGAEGSSWLEEDSAGVVRGADGRVSGQTRVQGALAWRGDCYLP